MTKLFDWVAERFCEAIVKGFEMAAEKIINRDAPQGPVLTHDRKVVVNGKGK